MIDAVGLDYWQHHGEQSTTARYINAICVTLILIASVVLNGGTLCVYYKCVLQYE